MRLSPPITATAQSSPGPVYIGSSWSQPDINDLYIFPAPQPSGDTVIIMTTNPMAGVMGPTTFLANAKYELLIDIDDDDHEDLVFG